MPTTISHPAGSFCWIELSTSDAGSAKSFYTRLFGWTAVDNPMGDMGVYTMLQKGGRDVGALYQQMPEQQGIPPNWLSYIAVAGVDATVAQAQERGAQLLAGPFDVFDFGRMAVLADPQGAAFALWEAKSHSGVGVRDEVGSLCWNELQARDVDAAKKFYPPLFGWRMKESDEYTEWHLGENAVGGMLVSQAPEGVPSFWLPYFAVDDADATAAQANELGGNVLVPPMDIEHVGRFAVLTDPQGAAFAVIRLAL